MIYRCIACGKTWGSEGGDNDSRCSGGLCRSCLKESLIPIYRKKQLREGNFDCFGKATCYCDQIHCLYRTKCLNAE